jgi:hypothetical protein
VAGAASVVAGAASVVAGAASVVAGAASVVAGAASVVAGASATVCAGGVVEAIPVFTVDTSAALTIPSFRFSLAPIWEGCRFWFGSAMDEVADTGIAVFVWVFAVFVVGADTGDGDVVICL